MSGPAAGYRPHLDGLRAVAVYLVVGFHAGWVRLEGGFIGVDLFFVLSGYLVTGVLLRDRAAEGRFRILRFYARRVRRLLPAALVVLVVTSAAYAAVASGVRVDDARGSVVAAALYVANWHFVAQSTDYFAEDVTSSPVLHVWSLNVEEQFYLVWPLLLAGGWLLLGRRRGGHRLLALAVAAGALASVAWAWSLRTDQLARAYYGTDTRAYQLLAGATLALLPGLRARLGRTGASTWGGLAGLGLVLLAATQALDLDPIERGVVATVGSAVAIAGIDLGPRRVVQAVLGWGPIAYLGRISYGTYLWHWPVIVVWREVADPPRPSVLAAAVAAVASGLAALSHALVESPIRTSPTLDRVPGKVVTAGATASVLAAVVVLPSVLSLLSDDGPPTIDWQTARDDRVVPITCTAETIDDCLVVEGDGPTVMLVGDSQAVMYVPMVAAAVEQLGGSLVAATMPACPWFVEVDAVMFASRCLAEKADWYGPVLDRYDPDVILLAHRRFDDANDPRPLGFPEGGAAPGDGAFEERVEAHTLATLEVVEAPGRRIAIIEGVPGPALDDDPIDCLSGSDQPLECHYVASDIGHETRFDRELAAERDDLWSISVDELVCPELPRCHAVVDGEVVWRDRFHLTQTFSRSLGPEFARILVEEGIVEPAVAD